jgi:uncharacterized protein
MSLGYSAPGAYVETYDADPQRIRLRRTDVGGFVGVAERGPINVPVKIESWRQYQSTFGGFLRDAYLAYSVNGFFQNGGRTCWVVRAGDLAGAATASATIDIEGFGRITLRATGPGAWGSRLTVRAAFQDHRISSLVIADDSGREQVIDLATLVRLVPARSGADEAREATRRAWQTNLLGVPDSELQELAGLPLVEAETGLRGAPGVTLSARQPSVQLGGGSDGRGTVTVAHLVGADDRVESGIGLLALERVQGISFVAIPDLMIGQDALPGTDAEPILRDADAMADAHRALIASCLRAKDRMALLDLPSRLTTASAVSYARSLPRESVAALYYPWLVVDDALRLLGPVRAVPPSGYVAGMFARVDRRRGVHKPPANEPLEGVYDTGVSLDVPTHGLLNDAGVNAIRAIPGRGILVLGARTLDPDVKWRYVNVRRLFLMIEQSLDRELQSLVFEPNSPQLWRDIRRTVTGFLDRLWQLGMLDGETAADAYEVRCDDTTNPPWETEQGRVTCVIGVQPPYPAEFVIVRIGVARDGVEIRTDEVRDG